MPNFRWTGILRPDRIGPMRHVHINIIILLNLLLNFNYEMCFMSCVVGQVPDHIQKPDYALSGIPHSEIQSNQQRKSILYSIYLLLSNIYKYVFSSNMER